LYFNYVQAIEFDQAPAGELRRGMGVRSDGSEFPVEISITKTQLDGQALYNLVVRDISAQEKADRELRLLAQVFSASAEAICILDTERRVISINPAFTHITGYAAEDIVGQTPDLLHSERYEPDFYPKVWVEMRRSGTWQGEIWYRHKTGREFAAWITLSQVVQKGGQPTHFVSAFTDITERKRSEERIRYMASHDTLTGLPNRISLDLLLTQSIAQARRGGKQVAVLFLDLDRFKTVNDSLGHHVGDMLLQAVAQRLRHSLRQSDAVARQGGDEFIIVIPDVHSVEHEVLAVARHVLDAVAKPYRVNDMELTITPSIGISLYPDDGTDIPTLIKHADAAMYAAKEAGRGSIRFFSRDMAERARERLSLENHLRGALARSELVLYYQPQIDMQSGRVVAVEALLRWFHPDLGLVSPGIFIPVAEESGLIVPIGRWVIREACRQNRIWQEQGLPQVPMAVNLSALQFEQQRLDEIVSSALADSGLDACWLELELTEGILIRDVEGAQRMLETLKNMGVRLAVDDFGTGYSSLSYLKRFPLDKLKIDRSFVMDLAVDQNDAAITAAIIGLGHHLGLRVVAEGVETQEQLAMLRAWGCDGIQGDLILPAAPPEDVRSLMAGQTNVVRVSQL
jgi:diguanylate cyclase (GGDEF)-like protein/PAS domain S-box-containing protein